MSRPQKIHPPLPFSFDEVLKVMGGGKITEKPKKKVVKKRKRK
jgi:hypothetical protein